MRKLVYDPLVALMEHYQGKKATTSNVDRSELPVEERLKGRIIDGDRIGLDSDLSEAMKQYDPLHIINTFLLDGMKVVGELFGSGQMQLPFVLQSAETMKAAVAWLEPFMEKSEDRSRGTMVIATVKGDVHDIGKNLVDIILTNNGYRVVNLGIKVPVDQMLEAVESNRAHALGMSGLLVKSTLVMKENLQIMRDREINIPVVLGGAALNRRYVEEDLRSIYGPSLAYAEDAFDGLHFMEQLEAGISDFSNVKEPAASDQTEGEGTEETSRPGQADRGTLHLSVARGGHIDRELLASVPRLSSLAQINDDQVLYTALLGEEEVGAARGLELGDGVWLIDPVGMLPQYERTGGLLTFLRLIATSIRESGNETEIYLISETEDKMRSMFLRSAGFIPVSGDEEKPTGENSRSRLEKYLNDIRGGSEQEITLLRARPELGAEKKSAETSRTNATPERSDVRRNVPVPLPPFWGTRIVRNIPVDKVFEYINEVALIRGQWGIRKGNRSQEEYRAELDERIYPKFDELKRTAKMVRIVEPQVVYGYFPCSSDGNRLLVYRPKGLEGDALVNEWNLSTSERPDRSDLEVWQTFDFPRQSDGRHLCLSDFFRSVDEAEVDVVPLQIVTIGRKATEYTSRLFAEGEYSDYLYVHGLSVESAEALAEYWHRSVRKELNIAGEDAEDLRKLFSQGYRGSRYSFGYPACPNLEDQQQLFEILRPERIGVELSEEFMLEPEQSTSAVVVHHPEAKYFNV